MSEVVLGLRMVVLNFRGAVTAPAPKGLLTSVIVASKRELAPYLRRVGDRPFVLTADAVLEVEG